jgi:hypothetical protein
MISLITILLTVFSTFHNNIEINKIDFIFKTDNRHLNSNFARCKTSFVLYTLTKEDTKMLEKIILNTSSKKKKNHIYLSIKHPYKTKYYFKTNDSFYFSIEEYKNSSFLITIVNSNNEVFVLVNRELSDNKFINQILNKIDQL